MPRLLIVDDSSTDRMIVRRLLSATNIDFEDATDGAAAIEELRRGEFDLVVSDVRMPRMNGLEFLSAAREEFPQTPVIIMTSRGTERTAAEALKRGAAGFVVKDHLGRELVAEVERQLEILGSVRGEERAPARRTRSLYHFELPTDPDMIADMIRLLSETAGRHGLPENEKVRFGVALEEALRNSVVHGNLDVGSELRESDQNDYEEMIQQRMAESPYGERRLFVTARIKSNEFEVVIRDEGRGFDVSSLPDPTDPENLLRASGRGVLLIKAFTDHAEYNSTGNRISIAKKLTPAGESAGPSEEEIAELREDAEQTEAVAI